MADTVLTSRLDNVSLGPGTSTTPSFAADAPATIVVGDQAFTVSPSQLSFDAPNLFVDALNGWAESSNRRMCVSHRLVRAEPAASCQIARQSCSV